MPYVTLPHFKTWHKFKSCKLSHIAAAAVLFGMSPQAVFAAEQDWWFDIEVIVFKRETSVTELSEKFANSEIKTSKTRAIDLLTPYLRPDLSYLRAGLAFCRASEKAKQQQQFAQDFALPKAVQDVVESELVKPAKKQPKTAVQEDFEYQVVSADIFDKKPLNDNSTNLVASNDLTRIKNRELSVDWIEWQIPQQLPCVYQEQLQLLANPFSAQDKNASALAHLERVPVKINGKPMLYKSRAFLLPQSELTLGSLFKGINKQRDLESMLHVGWRQEVKFGQSKALAIRLFAGQNYGQTYLTNGQKRPILDKQKLAPYIPLAEQHKLSAQDSSVLHDQALLQKNQDLFSAVFSALNNDETLKFKQPINYFKQDQNSEQSVVQDLALQEIWQLDGDMKVFLQNVGSTPYLHIESNMDFRQPVFDPSLVMSVDTSKATVMTGNVSREPNVIQNVKFNQFKRVISKQLHYFDHPLFGMVIYITRYNWPDETQLGQ